MVTSNYHYIIGTTVLIMVVGYNLVKTYLSYTGRK